MRSMWRGSISFGLVNIPVKMYAATEEKQIRFNQLHSLCHSRIRYVKVCPTCGREVNEDEIVRGYEYEKGRYAIFSKDELEKSERLQVLLTLFAFGPEEIDRFSIRHTT